MSYFLQGMYKVLNLDLRFREKFVFVGRDNVQSYVTRGSHHNWYKKQEPDTTIHKGEGKHDEETGNKEHKRSLKDEVKY